ncbi:MAG TPA: ABC transporter permease [Sumerlaeia bacterium]|nr:ABC transporter permease [Sumerlaeia bacterium]
MALNAEAATLSKDGRAARGASAPLLAFSVFRRELGHYFKSPGTYVALTFFFIVSGAFFSLIVADFVEACAAARAGTPRPDGAPTLNVTQTVVTQLFQALNFLMLLLVPMLTMRLIAEERRSGTFELLVTSPLGNWDILLGKYFAALVVGVAVLGVCAVYPLVCFLYSEPEGAVVLSCYLGLFLIIAAYTAFGLFASALSESQIAAAVLSFAGLLVFQMIGWLFKSGRLGRVAMELSVYRHSDNFTKGVIALSDVAFFVAFSVFFLFLGAQILDARRWRA